MTFLEEKLLAAAQVEQFLKAFYIFQDLSAAEFEHVGQIFRERKYPRGAFLFRQDEAPDELYLIQKGQVQVYRMTGNHRENIVAIENGETIGELALFGSSVHSASAVTLTDVTAFTAHGGDFARLLAQNAPGIGKVMGRLMEQTVRRFKLLEAKTMRAAAAAEEDTTPEGRLLLAMGRKEPVRLIVSTGTPKPMDGIFQVIDISSGLGTPMMRVAMEAAGREFIIPMASVHYIAFKDEKGKFGQ